MTAENHVFPDFNPAWTAQEAMEAGADGPLSPFFRWAAWQMLLEYRARYEAGDYQSLLAALRECACHDLPMPDWLANAYCRSHDDWLSFRKHSLDEAFRVAFPKGTHINKKRKMRTLGFAVPNRVSELSKQGRAIDASLFHDIGTEFNISGSTARDIYYGSWLYRSLQKNR